MSGGFKLLSRTRDSQDDAALLFTVTPNKTIHIMYTLCKENMVTARPLACPETLINT